MTYNVRIELPALNIPGIGKVVRSPTNSKQGPVLGFILSLVKTQLELEMIGARVFLCCAFLVSLVGFFHYVVFSQLLPFAPLHPLHPRLRPCQQASSRPTCLRPTRTSS
jgi:hypothetical protein